MYFPGGSAEAKFDDAEIVELLEWAIPIKWRQKFDLDGYIPTAHPKADLVTRCEAMERSEVLTKKKVIKTPLVAGKRNAKKQKHLSNNKSNSDAKNFNCSNCGKNSTHNTSSCFILNRKNKNLATANSTTRPTYTTKNFRKEINLMGKKKCAKVLQS